MKIRKIKRYKSFKILTVPWDLSTLIHCESFISWITNSRSYITFAKDGKTVHVYIKSLSEYQASNNKFKSY